MFASDSETPSTARVSFAVRLGTIYSLVDLTLSMKASSLFDETSTTRGFTCSTTVLQVKMGHVPQIMQLTLRDKVIAVITAVFKYKNLV